MFEASALSLTAHACFNPSSELLPITELVYTSYVWQVKLSICKHVLGRLGRNQVQKGR